MECSARIFRIALVVVFLAAQVSKAKPSLVSKKLGLLDEMPQRCSGADFCFVQHDNYPQDIIDALITTKYQLVLAPPQEVPSVGLGTLDKSQPDCHYNVSYGKIYEIVDNYGNVRVVVQSDVFKQQLKIVQCVNSGRLLLENDTENFSEADMHYHNLVCEEVIQDYSFLVLTPDGSGVEYVKTKKGVPVACNCTLIQ